MKKNDKEFPFGKYKKATYQLWQDSVLRYFFTTTIHSEKECIEILKNKAQTLLRNSSYKIIKKSEGQQKVFDIKVTHEHPNSLTQECMDFIKENYLDFTDKEICRKFDTTPTRVYKFRHKNNLFKDK
jgi:hypothetical protein